MSVTSKGLVLSVAASLSVAAATIPPDLETRAVELRKHASPQVLAWAHDRGLALARARGPVDVGALEQSIRSQFVATRAPATRSTTIIGDSGPTYQNLGSMADGDIMALCFIVMMEAAKSAHEDLKAAMNGVKEINKQKDRWTNAPDKGKKPAAGTFLSPTPTPTPDRVAELVVAARSVHDKAHAANLSRMARR